MSVTETARIIAATSARNERPQFFARMALVMAAVVVLSFPVTYFVPVSTGSGKFHALHHVPALASFAWFGLYVWQTQLVARRHIARHREIGLAGSFELGANVGAVVITASASGTATTAGSTATASGGKKDAATAGKYDKGTAIFVISKGGLMYEASVSGQKFSYEPKK